MSPRSGSGALKDLALALFVGMAAGAYSSIFIATPLAVQLKSNEKEITQQDARAKARARRDVDRYADVPVFTDDMPVRDADDELDPAVDERRGPAGARSAAPPPTPEASGSGRVVPDAEEAAERLAARPAARSRPGSRAPSAASEPDDVDVTRARPRA